MRNSPEILVSITNWIHNSEGIIHLAIVVVLFALLAVLLKTEKDN